MRWMLPLLLLASLSSATDLGVKYTHTVTAADTAAQRIIRDTIYTPWTYLPDMGRRFWFSTQIDNGGTSADTAISTDTFLVIFQTASFPSTDIGLTPKFTRINHVLSTGGGAAIALTSADNDTIVNMTTSLNRDSVWTGDWARGMFIYADTATTAIGRTSSIRVGNVRTYHLKLWINAVR
jgi:hypothetical protein